jgi:hypothetical protein
LRRDFHRALILFSPRFRCDANMGEDVAAAPAAAMAAPRAAPPASEHVVATLPPPPGAPEGTQAILISRYLDESALPDMMALIARDLSEPYSIFT